MVRRLGDRPRAKTLYDLLRPYAGRAVVVGPPPNAFWGPASHYLGELAATMGDVDRAAQHFEEALEMNTSMGARPFLALTQHAYAGLLLSRGETDRALALLDEAIDTARELGMRPLEGRAEALRLRAGGGEGTRSGG